MRPSYRPRLVNGPFGYPGLYLAFQLQNRALLFDLGDISALSSRDILKVSHVFVSHTHMDHFIGFDRLLRLSLGRSKKLHLYGPAGFQENVRGKLAAYTWNLVQRYENPLALHVTEVRPQSRLHAVYRCRDRFRPAEIREQATCDRTLVSEPAFTVAAAILDHGTSCLGFSVKERFHINILKARLDELGLPVGPWLGTFKRAVFSQAPPDTPIQIAGGGSARAGHALALGDLLPQIARVTPGQKVTYITDVGHTSSNATRIVELAQGSDHLFIEAAFADVHARLAAAKHHLTAGQAGRLAARAHVKRLTVFHFSPRYTGSGVLLEKEALAAFEQG